MTTIAITATIMGLAALVALTTKTRPLGGRWPCEDIDDNEEEECE